MRSAPLDPVSTPSAPRRPVTAIVAALTEELAPLVARTDVTHRTRIGPLRVYRGRLSGAEVLLARTGDGRRSAEHGTEKLLRSFPVGRLLAVGVAGGLCPSLSSGTLVVADDVLDTRAPVPPPDPAWRDLAVRCDGAWSATVMSSERLLCTPVAKREAWHALPRRDPAVVDLESATYARVAASHGTPYLVVRAVCDPAEENLPFDLNLCSDEDGGISRYKVLRYALLHPGVIASLWELRKRVDRCSRRIAGFVEQLLHEESASHGRGGTTHETGGN